jgi:3-hydroxybutyryl-CoA dehydratase
VSRLTGDHKMRDYLPRGTLTIDQLEIGMTRQLQKLITDRDIELFAEVSTDHNPVHMDEAYARDTMFQGRIAHGMLTASLISAVIGEQLPGYGSIYLEQNLRFLAPVRPGDTALAEVEVVDINHEKRRVTLDCRCTVGGKKVLSGQATVLAPAAPIMAA